MKVNTNYLLEIEINSRYRIFCQGTDLKLYVFFFLLYLVQCRSYCFFLFWYFNASVTNTVSIFDLHQSYTSKYQNCSYLVSRITKIIVKLTICQIAPRI